MPLDSPTTEAPFGVVAHDVTKITSAGVSASPDWIVDEVPVALVYNGISHVVMMATATQLEEFATGFSLTEGIIRDLSDIYSIEVTDGCREGKNVEITIASECFWKLKDKRRNLVGRTGCGICGTESLDQAVRKAPSVPHAQTFDLKHYPQALSHITTVEKLGSLTGATHCAVWVNSDGSLAGGCEDVGRHVALDKLLGLRARQGWKDGIVIVSSRASYEMVQKCAVCGVEILLAMSAPTRLAVEMAETSGMTLAAFCRPGRLNVYTHPERLTGQLAAS